MGLNPRGDRWTTVNGRTTRQAHHREALPEANRESGRMDVRRVHVWLLGPRDYPERLVKIPEHFARDLPDLVACAQEANPATTPDAVVQTIWRLGSYRLRQNLLRGIPVKVSDLPLP